MSDTNPRPQQRRNWRKEWRHYRQHGNTRPALSRRQRRHLWRMEWRERNTPALDGSEQ